MQVSKQKMNRLLGKQLDRTVYQMISDIKRVDESERILGGILSPTELATVIKRVGIAYWLHKGRSYENIKNNLKVSSASISEIQRQIKTPGWQLTLKYLEAEEWANVWEQKIKNVFKRK